MRKLRRSATKPPRRQVWAVLTERSMQVAPNAAVALEAEMSPYC